VYVACVDLTEERKDHRKPKISRMEGHHTSNPWIYLEVKRSKVKITRPINAVCHIFRTGRSTKFKLGTQMEHEDSPHRRQASTRSKAKVARSRGESDRCWPVSRERKFPNWWEGCPPHDQSCAPVSRSKSLRSRSPATNAETERPGRLTNIKIGTKVAQPTGNDTHQFQGQKVKGQGHQANAQVADATWLM